MGRVGGLAVVAMACVCAGLVGCSSGEPANDVVPAFMKAVQSGDYATACQYLDPQEAKQIRIQALGEFQATSSTTLGRRAQIQRASAQARTCPGALALRSEQLGPQRLKRVADQAARAAVTDMPDGTKTLTDNGNYVWALSQHQGRWIITYAAQEFG